MRSIEIEIDDNEDEDSIRDVVGNMLELISQSGSNYHIAIVVRDTTGMIRVASNTRPEPLLRAAADISVHDKEPATAPQVN